MTICKGFGTMTAPCCGARYPFPLYDSMNFSADAHWTDGWNERSLMPNEDGIRRCKCGQFLMLAQMDEDETQDGSDLPDMDKVTLAWLPECIAKATSVHMEIAARVSYWKHLNHDYRQRFKLYKQYVLPELSFEPSSVQRDNLERLVELFSQNDANYSRTFRLLERAEIHRELGQFDLALAMLDRIHPEDRDEVVDLMRRLCVEKQIAPWRYKWGSGSPAKLVC